MSKPHVVLLPSAGMGHLTPFLRIAAALLSRSCHVTLITAVPTVSAAESSHISSFLSDNPQVNHAHLHILPNPNPQQEQEKDKQDPFFVQFEATRRSAAAQLRPLLLTSSPISAVFADLAVTTSASPIAAELGIPFYAVVTSSVRFLCVAARLPSGFGFGSDAVEIPGLGPVLSSSVPQLLKDPSQIFTRILAENVKALLQGSTQGILVNSFEWLEWEAIQAINGGKVSDSLPKVIPIGPLYTCPSPLPPTSHTPEKYTAWLDAQPPSSVVYVSFGSRTAMSKDQIRELHKGLEISGHRFLWVLKTSKVDKEEKEEEEDPVVVTERGMVVREWVRQHEILCHVAVGAFVSHCGWNSATEAARRGVPVLTWPLHGDQRLNAEVIGNSGLGVWPAGWGSEELVVGEEIGERVREVMGNRELRESARNVGREAEKALARGGSSDEAMGEVLEFLKTRR